MRFEKNTETTLANPVVHKVRASLFVTSYIKKSTVEVVNGGIVGKVFP